MYIFINENKIEEYNGQPLKRFVGNRLIKVISNPTDNDLLEFGYMPLEENAAPEYDAGTQYLVGKYSVADGKIYKAYEVCDIPKDDTEGVGNDG